MTLEEMIKQEQENAQKNQEAVKVEESQKVEQHFGGSEDNNAQQTTQTQTQSSGTTISTIASSSDEHVNREEFSLKTKSFTPTLVPEDFYTVKLIGIDKKEAKDLYILVMYVKKLLMENLMKLNYHISICVQQIIKVLGDGIKNYIIRQSKYVMNVQTS